MGGGGWGHKGTGLYRKQYNKLLPLKQTVLS